MARWHTMRSAPRNGDKVMLWCSDGTRRKGYFHEPHWWIVATSKTGAPIARVACGHHYPGTDWVRATGWRKLDRWMR